MPEQLLCLYCHQPAEYNPEARSSVGTCKSCQVEGRVFRVGDFMFWGMNTVELRAGVGAKIEVNNGAGEMHPGHLRRTVPRWGYGEVVGADDRWLTIQFEVPYFGRLQERLPRNSVRLAPPAASAQSCP